MLHRFFLGLGIISSIVLVFVGIYYELFLLFLLLSIISLIHTSIFSWVIYAIGETNISANNSSYYSKESANNTSKSAPSYSLLSSSKATKQATLNSTKKQSNPYFSATELDYFKNNKSGFSSNNKE